MIAKANVLTCKNVERSASIRGFDGNQYANTLYRQKDCRNLKIIDQWPRIFRFFAILTF